MTDEELNRLRTALWLHAEAVWRLQTYAAAREEELAAIARWQREQVAANTELRGFADRLERGGVIIGDQAAEHIRSILNRLEGKS